MAADTAGAAECEAKLALDPELFLQWKNIPDVCFDFYCPCNPGEPQHFDGHTFGRFTCGSAEWDDDDGPEPDWCGRQWELPWKIRAGIKEAERG